MEKTERLSRTASVAYTKGLLNNPGENNCFLNSAVQVLWHLDVFRRSFRELSGHFCAGESCIFCALKVLFTQIQYSDEAALPPDALRQALAVTFKDQQRFQLQDMDDAAECLENILNRLHFHLAMNEKDEICNAAHCISHRKFAMEIMEQTICNCGETSEPLPFFQLVHYVSVSALCREADILSTKLRGLNQDMFGHLLKRTVNQGDTRECPGNCGKRISVQQSLLNCPDVVCIGLIWDSDNPDVEQISQLLDCIDTVLRLPEVFPRVSDDKAKKVELLLAGVVTYYGKHYSTFFYSNKMKTWIYFDDARVRKCGPDWEKIRYKCYQNHYQPLLLLYVNPHGRPVSTKSAPAEVKLVDTETLLASGESARNRGSISSEKAMDIIGGTPSAVSEPNRKSKSVESVDGLLSSSSSHSVGSIRYSEKETQGSSPDRKKNKRSMKRLKIIGTDIVKKALSRSRPNSPTPELRDSTNSLDALGSEKVQAPKKFNSDEDLIDLSSDVRSKNIMSLFEHSTRGHEVDETDSGLGSGGSQASSPATSSVSSVDTNTDDLIDFTTRMFPRTAKGNENHRLDGMVEEAESLLRRSYDIEKTGDLALSLSLCTNASTRFRIAIEKCSAAQYPAYLASLKNKHNLCLERSRKLHQQITAEKETSGPQFTRQEKQQLLMRQRERDQQVIRQLKQTPTVQGTLPRSTTKGRNGGVQFNGVAPMSIKSVSEVPLSNYCGMDGSNSPATARRPSSRSHYPGSVGTCRTPDDESRDKVNCSQKIKPDMLCYSPVHYGKPDGLSSDFERLKVNREGSRQDRIPTVTHVSTSFIPLKSLPIERTLSTSAAYRSPNSRTALNDARRFSIYDNMPPRDDYRKTPAVPPRRTASPSPSCPANTSLIRVFNQENEERARSTDTPPYVDPPPYHRTRTYQSTTTSENQPSTLLQRFNVPSPSKSLESVGLPDDIRRINEELLAARPLCQRCHGVPVEKSKTMCTPCQALDSMLHDLNGDTAALY